MVALVTTRRESAGRGRHQHRREASVARCGSLTSGHGHKSVIARSSPLPRGVTAQIDPLCAGFKLLKPVARTEQIGGSRAAAAASGFDAVLQPIQSVSDLIAD
jgi:hypothetical protein